MSAKIIGVIVLLITATLLPLILSDASAGNGFGNCISPTHARLNDVQMLGLNDGWAVGDGGTIIRWNGTSWYNVTSPTTRNLYGLHMLSSSSDGWAVGEQGITIRWSAGTHQWNVVSNPFNSASWHVGESRYLRSIYMIDSNYAWAVGGLKYFARGSTPPYTFGWVIEGLTMRWNGSAWTDLSYTADEVPLSVCMINDYFGWIVGEQGYIAKWNGNIWTSVSSPVSYDLNSVNFNASSSFTGTPGWIVGDNGTIVGLQWGAPFSISSPTTLHLNAVDIVGTNNSWAVGNNGTVIRFDGSSWKNYTSSTTTNLQAISIIRGISRTDGFAVGDNGTILRIDNYQPHTTASYEGVDQWHQSDIQVALDSFDDAAADTGINFTYYKINDGDTKSVEADGYPIVTTEGPNNNITYWSADRAGNIEQPTHTTGNIKLDKTPPICTTMQILGGTTLPNGITYTGFTNVTLALQAIDGSLGSGVYQMRFSNDSGQQWSDWEAYSESKEWNLTDGDGPKKVQAQFSDNAGWISESYSATINVDTLPPVLQIVSPLNTQNGTEVKASSFKLEWSSSDAGQIPVSSYEVKQDSGDWVSLGNSTTSYTFTGLGDGEHLLQIRTTDTSGKSSVYSLKILANTSPIGGPGYLEESLIGVAAGIAVAAPIVYKWRKRPKPPPSPKTLKLQADPTEVIADRQSKSTITVQLLDGSGKPIVAPGDIEVKLNASKGKIETPVVTIPKGKDAEKTYLISSVEIGPATVSADAKGLKSLGLTLNFVEKKRYCMHCGSIMPFTAKLCQKCGNSPPAGVDTKACMNCESVIPVVAKFCSECGAGQTDSRTD